MFLCSQPGNTFKCGLTALWSMCFFTATQAAEVLTVKRANQTIQTASIDNKLYGKLTISVETESESDEPAMSATAVVRKGDRVLQRIEIPSGMRFYKPGDSLLSLRDVDNDGNADFLVLWEDSKNSMWALYRFDVATSRFKHERDWVNPRFDKANRCVIERTQGGHAGAIGVMTLTCRQGERWVKRFERDQSKYVPTKSQDGECPNGSDYRVIQRDWSTVPSRIQTFTLKCEGDMQKRLPKWVGKIVSRAVP
jgi:hypothetical protein